MKAFALRALLASSAIVLIASAGQAIAQQAPGEPVQQGTGDGAIPSPQAQAASPGGVSQVEGQAGPVTTQDIVVTALKREQSLLKVPATVTVLSGDNLKTQGVNNLTDLQNVVPAVNISTGRDGVTVNVRGVTTTDTSSKGEQDVAFNIDGVYVGRGNARGAAFFDVERVEVLRGPQGTLYGRSSTGGAINVITKAPVLGEFGGYVRAEYGNYQAKRAEGAINVPLGDTVALRFSGNFNERDGYSKPFAHSVIYTKPGTTTPVTYRFSETSAPARNDQSDATARISILYKPDDNLSLRLTAAFGHQGGSAPAAALETELQKHNDKASGLGILAYPIAAFTRANFQNYDAHLNYTFGDLVNLEVMGSYQHLKYLQQGPSVLDTNQGYFICREGGGPRAPFPNCSGPGFNFYYQQNEPKTKQIELRVTNANPGLIDYVAGVNFFNEAAAENGQSWVAPIDTPDNTNTYIFNAGPVNTTKHISYGVFGQATVNVTDQLGIVGGIRYTSNEVQRRGRFSLPFNIPTTFLPWPDVAGNPICTFPNACLGNLNPGGSKDDKITYKLGVNYQVDPANLVYASLATGFKGGTFNDFDVNLNAGAAVPPSSVTAYEVGYKGRPLPGFTLTSSAFYYDFDKYAVTGGLLLAGGAVNVGQFTQITPVKFYGWENEFSYQVLPQTSFDGSFSLLKTKFTNFRAGQRAALGVFRDFSGDPIDFAPTFQATGGINQAVDLTGDLKLRLRGFIKYSNGYFVSNFAQAVRYRQPSFTRSNASATFDFKGGAYSVQFFVENIENKVQRVGNLGGYAGAAALYGGVGGSNTVAGNGQIPTNIPANFLNFNVTTPRFYGVRLSTKF